ncbi:MAG TPA: DNA-3-methyladenine glycosylase [Candidatus Dormibacteraeota bacterium]|nr:DNA-3-methyladenine glycosylase [Candidatus Dormibacteraeota bacterium]
MSNSSELSGLLETAPEVAPRLLGCLLEREVGGSRLLVRIVETEAYDQSDVASHSYKGVTPKNKVMFGTSGHLYVYFTYGMHYCCNVVVGPKGHGSAVLIRAVEPIEGEDIMSANRHGRTGIDLTNGPAKLCQALVIDKLLNGHDLKRQPLRLIMKDALPTNAIEQATRIGISRAKDVPWRFYIRANPYVSRT